MEISRKTVIYAMSPHNPPAARAESGATVCFETIDCFGGQITSPEQRLGGLDWDNINPATGPLYVEGAQPGDVLKVEILDIALADHGVMTDAPNEGVIGAVLTEESTKLIPIRAGRAVFNDKLSFPIRPMIGVIGTAPAAGAVPTGTPGPHGGNMDCKRIGPGATLYLPVAVEGALLAMGDLHAVMGDGEVVVCGVEIAGRVTVRVTVLHDCPLPTPFLTTETAFMTISSASTLEAAASDATLRMREVLIHQVGMEAHEAGMLLSAAGDVRICQMVDPQVTCRMEVPLAVAESYGYAFP